MPKKSEKKEPPAPQPEPEPEPEFKLPKKKPSRQIPKEEKKEEESPFGKVSLKKSQTVKRTWNEPTMETVDLKHHEFERAPQDVEVAELSLVVETRPITCFCSLKEPQLSNWARCLTVILMKRKKSRKRRNLKRKKLNLNLNQNLNPKKRRRKRRI